MTGIARNIEEIRKTIPEGVRLVAVSKFHPAEAIMEAYGAGQRIFGESRAQELVAKHKVLPADIEWHFIGPLQTNKVKDIVPFVSLIHSVDSSRLLLEIEKQAARVDRVIDVLLELRVAREETKHGLDEADSEALLTGGLLDGLTHVRLKGVMGMATNTDDMDEVRLEFRQIRERFERMRAMLGERAAGFTEISMGMSHDYPLAIDEGSTMIRVGTSIFGEREY
ncbi:MAG TPA: YggS family pyridoxal phosphate-dependent enzyme [Candidatus Parabacteroides intestinipullorum]|jgi:hypothetical protein|uniref:Pyridoxal phosphate homeostasis protein n=1 Tax=Candidatus Parabacteroides intestinipullorum TaxID=2838723 RepID=A0A9D1X9E1_9BACT|nr:YggS family pyridoxal phosphate-dependent enzyme [Candidatus Parabacteroides intestinipullorum]